MPGNYAGSVRTDVVGVGPFFSIAMRTLGACEAHHNDDRKTLLMSPFEIRIERHVN